MQKSALTRPFTLRRCKGVSIMCELALRKALLHRCKGVSSPFIKWIVRSLGPAHEHDSSIVVASQNIYVLIYFYANSGSPSDRCRCCSNVLVWRLHWYYETCAGYGNSKASFFFFFSFLFMKNITFDNVSTNFLCYHFSGHQLLGLSIWHLFRNSVPKADKRKDHCSCLSCWMVTSAKNELL